MASNRSLPPISDPLWYKDAVVYQVHVKSFFDANNDGMGDFPGLMQKLSYIKELGVTAIWLLPFYPSPLRDDGYDIAEYRGVNPDYGTLADVRHFIRTAHELGLRVITELVINHTSDAHPWFQRARRAKPGSAARNFYVWSDDDQRYAGTRIIFLDTEKSNWTWDPIANAYFWHRFYAHQPDLNYDNPAVLRAVLSVMRFWFELGVDGLRLDAVPYLVEREGTINENLPETHDILKRIRAELDASAPGRMLLAEANQWPEDVQEYFGSGDECHMAFHFPLMPRMYMSIAREDRFPITDIMRQTPEIPPTCQWAIFLRNHDELTLEMVTDQERDYLWETYASDRRARLNLGIRRRLAPLMEHDRRRIELMNNLLLSMPGTPIIYYGDEIGMGDNIHLGDRSGVRTPMQWSPDRNGGFSRANPANLVLPAIMDSVYGYDAVNVEAQSADPHSLLNWMRRMIAVRARFHAFGRGTQRLLYPGNRKILAFLREYSDGETHETVLCVSNLSRTAQAVELSLSEFAGRLPVDMIGGAVFPPIGQLSYLLTLPPYGFLWFVLTTEAALPPWHVPAPQPLPEFVTLVVRRDIDEVLAPAPRAMLENDILPAYLPKRRWFAAKDERLKRCRISYGVPLSTGGDAVLLVEVEAELPNHREHYLLPLGVVWPEDSTEALPEQLGLARLRRNRRVGMLTDGFAVDGLVQAIVTGLRAGSSLALPEGGTVRFLPTARLAETEIPPAPDIRRLSAEQTNSSLVVGDVAVIKLIRRVTAGIHPEAEMTRHLTERGFPNIAALLGEVVRVDTDGTSHTLILLQAFVRNQGDGWTWTMDFLARTVEELALTDADEAAKADAFAAYLTFAGTLGRRLAELHAVLAAPSDDPAFAPEPADASALRGWASSARAQIDHAAETLRAMKTWPDEATEAMAADLLEQAPALREAIDRLAEEGTGALCTRVHGDFHLGQVLTVQDDVYLIDFEGEPARPLAERRMKSSPLRDVAGLLRSIDYAAAAAGLDQVGLPTPVSPRRGELLERFRIDAKAAFLDAYDAAQAAAERKWSDAASQPALLDLFLIEKAAYEVRYEAANRPGWLPIPLRGLAELAARVTAPVEPVDAGHV
ncbi:MAG: maltose alpha-D-glucosyltransferase [Rhodospirillales bacterium]|nr:maltose alpha-D-glucosyltransferase [Rhodospirillales bacterium]